MARGFNFPVGRVGFEALKKAPSIIYINIYYLDYLYITVSYI